MAHKYKLAILSGGQHQSNRNIHRYIVKHFKNKKTSQMTYIPYCEDGHRPFYSRFVRRYKTLGVQKFHCLPIDLEIKKRDLDKIYKSDAIYLAGGNTFYFLKYIQQQNLIDFLHEYSAKGGILIGLSAGGIIMTPNIRLAGHPQLDPDPNDVKLKNLKSLRLVQFEYMPHYIPTYDKTLKQYSKFCRHPILASPDGSGVFIERKQTTFFGSHTLFYQGKKLNLKFLSGNLL